MLNPREIRTIEDAKRIVEERQLTHVKVGLFDIDGVMLGKYMSRNKFFRLWSMVLLFVMSF